MRLSLPVAGAITIGTFVACGVMIYAVRGWWRLATIPIWLLYLLNLVVLWYWNV